MDDETDETVESWVRRGLLVGRGTVKSEDVNQKRRRTCVNFFSCTETFTCLRKKLKKGVNDVDMNWAKGKRN